MKFILIMLGIMLLALGVAAYFTGALDDSAGQAPVTVHHDDSQFNFKTP